MDDAHEPAQLAAFLTALRAKGETAAELGGMLDALMDRVIQHGDLLPYRVVAG